MNSKKYKDVLYEVREITDLRDMIRSSAELFSDDPAFLVKEVPAGEYVPITYRTLKSDIDCLGTYFAKVGMKGKKIAVIGGGAVGLDVVEFFAARKADISIVEMMDQIGRDLDPVTKNDMKCQMKTHGVHQLTQTALLEVKEHSFLVKGSDGSYELPFDYGFVCLGMRAKGQLYPQLLDAFADDDVEILNIGDSQRARRIIDGTMEGRNILYHLTQRGYLD